MSKLQVEFSSNLSGVLARLVSRYYLILLGLTIGLSWLSYQAAMQIRLDTSLEALMPDGVASVENLHETLDRTGSFASAIVVISTPVEDEGKSGVRFAQDLRSLVLSQYDWVAAAEYSEDLTVFERHKLLYLDIAELGNLRSELEELLNIVDADWSATFDGIPVNVHLRLTPVLPPTVKEKLSKIAGRLDEGQDTSRLFQNDDQSVTLLVVWPGQGRTGLRASRQIINDLRDAAAKLKPTDYDPRLTAEVGGRIYSLVVQFDAVIDDFSSSGMWSLSAIFLLLTLFFRSFWALPLIAIPLSLGILWTMGLTGLVIGQLNLVTVFLVLILFGLGVDFGIHNLTRYREERSRHASPEVALEAVFKHTGSASLVAGLTTAAGFLALLVTDFRAFYEFGFIAGTGVLLTFLAMYTVFPALLIMAEHMGADFSISIPIANDANPPSATIGGRLAQPSLSYPGLTLAALGLISLGAVWQSVDIGFENDFSRLQAKWSPSHMAMYDKINTVFPDPTDRAILIVDTVEEAAAIKHYFEKYITSDTETPTIKRVDTFYTMVPEPEEQAKRLAIISDIRDLVEGETLPQEFEREAPAGWRNYLEIGQLTPPDLPEAMRHVFTGLPDKGGHLIYIFNEVDMNLADQAQLFADDIREIPIGEKIYYPASEDLVFVDMQNLMKRDALTAILAVTIVTIILVSLFFRNLAKILLVLVPPALGLLILFGVMGAFDIRLSIFNMVILPTLIGIGVDNSIHIVHRAREEKGMARGISGAGGAAAVTTLTTLFGFAGMISANMGGLYSLGLVAAVGFSALLLATFTALPALAMIIERRQLEKTSSG